MRRRTFDRQQIAKIIEEAEEAHLDVIGTVAEVLDIDRRRAWYYVRVTRAEGIVRPLSEHRPARAWIHRGASNEKAWDVCETCLVRWPCQSFIDEPARPPRAR